VVRRKTSQPCSHSFNSVNVNPEYRRFKTQEYRLKILQLLGNKCVKCGYDKDIRGLCIDHVNGGGNEERGRKGKCRKTHSSQTYYYHILSKILTGSKDYQCLCATCNQIKQFERNE
jgi:hypothetical protein